jgi:hypothetical protein
LAFPREEQKAQNPRRELLGNYARNLGSSVRIIAVAEDFNTINGKIYKDATISRVEADGIVVRTKTGISKIYFVELPKDVQERFLPTPAKTVAAQRERQPTKIEKKKDESPQTDRSGLPAGLLISGGLIKLFFAVATVIITGVVLAFIRSRFR